MNKKTNYNSIVFLTTLSVYLGLVLVGGAPQVFAQAAMTRDFDIKTEIEFKDDLDNKPDEDLFAVSVSNLVDELNDFSQKKFFDWNAKGEFQIEGLGFCESDDSPSFMGSGTISRRVDYALEKTALEIARKLFRTKDGLGLGDVYSHGADFKFVFDGKTLNIEAGIAGHNEKDIQPFVNELTAYLIRISSSPEATKEKIVVENTKVTFENRQVFLVIHLPRASIDELLARKSHNRSGEKRKI